jgi:hypothetical protein
LSILALISWTTGILFRNVLYMPLQCIYLPYVLLFKDLPYVFRQQFQSFKVSGPPLRFLICFELTFVNGEREGSSCNLLYVDIQFYQHHLLIKLSIFSNVCLWHLYWKSNDVTAWGYFWIFYFISLIYASVFAPVLGCFCYYGSIA